MKDRLHVVQYPVSVTPVQGAALDDLKKHLLVMEAELGHLVTAVRDMKNGISTNSSRLLTGGVMNSRNWAASVVMSHCYVQSLLGANAGDNAANDHIVSRFHLYDLFKRAAEMGVNDAIETRRRLNVRPTNIFAQVNWDGKIQ
jgi:hypothetical protein